MQNVSFGSNYTFQVPTREYKNINDSIINMDENSEISVRTNYHKNQNPNYQTSLLDVSLTSPDELDKKIECFLSNRNIDFHKKSYDDIMHPDSVKERIALSDLDKKRSCSLVEIDTDKLDEMFKKDQISYVSSTGHNYDRGKYQKFADYVKTGEPIDAINVLLVSIGGKLEACILDGKHRFAYLRDIGIKKMPVSLDGYSAQVAKDYGLF